MTSGKKGSQRDQLLAEREARLLKAMEQNRPLKAIAELEGLEVDYTGKMCAALAKQHGIDYKPEGKRQQHSNALPPGLSSRSDGFRRRAATALYLWTVKTKKHPLQICCETGLTQAAQRTATKAHGPFNWHLSHLDRWAEAMGVSFEELILDLTFDPETAARMKTCLKSKTD